MIASLKRLREPTIAACHAMTLAMTRALVRNRSGARRFDRVAIVAAFGRRNGITRGAELQHAAMLRAGVDAEMIDATAALRNPFHRVPHRPATCYIFHTGGPQTAWLVSSVLPAAADAYRIAYWAWELPVPPEDWAPQASLVSEIWTPSQFSRRGLEQISGIPVHVAPHNVALVDGRDEEGERPFTVLTMADSRSSFARKNPLGAVQAFRSAFGDSARARLIVKLNGRPHEMAALAESIGTSANIQVVTDHLDAAGMRDLYRSSDVLLSLHRAEGFGLPMLEAMAHGVAVVATGWSGCMEFLSERNSVLVPYDLVPVRDPYGLYRDGVWAEPCIAAAGETLRQLAANPALRQRIAKAGRNAAALQMRLPFHTAPALDLDVAAMAPAAVPA